MNKAELIAAVVAKHEKDFASKAASERIVSEVFDTIMAEVSAGNSVVIAGFGTFKSVGRAAKTGRNPRTGEDVQIPAKTVARFSAGKGFKTAVNK